MGSPQELLDDVDRHSSDIDKIIILLIPGRLVATKPNASFLMNVSLFNFSTTLGLFDEIFVPTQWF